MNNNQTNVSDTIHDYHIKQIDDSLVVILKDLPDIANGQDISAIKYTIINLREEISDRDFKLSGQNLDRVFKIIAGINKDLLPIIAVAQARLDKRKKIFKLVSYASYAVVGICSAIVIINKLK
jgi:hypothetical protein